MYAEIEHQAWVRDYAIDTGERSTLTPEQTRDILDALDIEQVKAIREDGEDGDLIAYTAEEAGWWTGPEGPFYVRLYNDDNTPMDDVDREEAFDAYIADRRKRGVNDDTGDDKIVKRSGLMAKIEKINDLIASLPEDGSVLWLSTDGSWGGATDLSLCERDTLPEDVLDAYEIDLTAL